MRREICGEKKTSKRLTQTQWGWTQQSVLSSLVCSHPSYPCMSLILDYKESGGVAFTTKETCTAGRTKKEWEPCASAKAGISLLHSPPHILFTRLPSPIPNTTKPLNQKLHSPPMFPLHQLSYGLSLSQSGISIWSEMAKEKNHQWNIQHIHIWLLLMEGSRVVKGEVLGVVRRFYTPWRVS